MIYYLTILNILRIAPKYRFLQLPRSIESLPLSSDGLALHEAHERGALLACP